MALERGAGATGVSGAASRPAAGALVREVHDHEVDAVRAVRERRRKRPEGARMG
jgi:hypothetical protein